MSNRNELVVKHLASYIIILCIATKTRVSNALTFITVFTVGLCDVMSSACSFAYVLYKSWLFVIYCHFVLCRTHWMFNVFLYMCKRPEACIAINPFLFLSCLVNYDAINVFPYICVVIGLTLFIGRFYTVMEYAATVLYACGPVIRRSTFVPNNIM